MPDYSAFPLTEGVRTFLAAPEGYEVDFENPVRNHELTLYLVIGIGNVLAALFMFQRLYTKLVLLKVFLIEDGFLVFSWLCSLLVQGVTLCMSFSPPSQTDLRISWKFSTDSGIKGSIVIGARGTHAWEQPIERYVHFKIVSFFSSLSRFHLGCTPGTDTQPSSPST